ncbi:MAG: hypothetical protein RIR48_2490 [Bacteroidota bacterium]|jgi:hypothetical protein
MMDSIGAGGCKWKPYLDDQLAHSRVSGALHRFGGFWIGTYTWIGSGAFVIYFLILKNYAERNILNRRRKPTS